MADVRQFRDDEFESFLKIRGKALATDPSAFMVTLEAFESRDEYLKKQRFSRHVKKDDHLIVGAFEDEQCVGMTGLVRIHPDSVRGKVWGVFVEPQYRGQGLGKKMLNLITQESAGFDWMKELVLSVNNDNEQAIRVYEEVGFEKFQPEENNPLMMTKCAQETHMRRARAT